MGIGTSAAVTLAILALLPGVEPPPDSGAAARALGPGRVRLSVVYDNAGAAPSMIADWGFSCLVEREDRRILFDSGRTPATLIENMRAVGVSPESLDAVVISHAHADHTGGLAALRTEVPDLRVYVASPLGPANAPAGSGDTFVEVDQAIEIVPGMVVTRPLSAGTGLVEMALVVATQQGLAVITGCAHPGLVDVVIEAKRAAAERGLDAREVHLVMGGFHLRELTVDRLGTVIRDLERLGVRRVVPSHCTGEAATAAFAAAFGPRLVKSGLGSVVTIGAPSASASHAASGR